MDRSSHSARAGRASRRFSASLPASPPTAGVAASSWRLAWLLGCALLVTGLGCSKTIGDSCGSNVECSALGDRFCDIASPGGYCTIEGCDQISCPDSAVCVRFFELKRGQAMCTANLTSRTDCPAANTRPQSVACCRPGEPGCCQLGERCLCDDESCKSAYCAAETTEHRWCMKPCDDDSDCRDGYACRPTDSGGAIAVATRTDAGVQDLPRLRYCAPIPAPR